MYRSREVFSVICFKTAGIVGNVVLRLCVWSNDVFVFIARCD